jgi:hypothetical protein
MFERTSKNLPRWLPGTIVGALITFGFLGFVWPSFSSIVKQNITAEVQGNLIATLGTAILVIFLALVALERQIRDEWEPAVGGVLGCLLVLFIALIAALL